MLEIFRRNLFINNVLLLPYIFILRFDTLIKPIPYIVNKSENILIISLLKHLSGPLWQNIFSNILIFFQVLLINHLFIKHRISREITLFSGIVYILLLGLVTTNSLLLPILIANTFVILALNCILDTYKLPDASANIFNSGFYIGFASVIYTPYFALILFGIIALLLLRSFKLQEKVQFIVGLSIPYIFLFTYKYWFDIKFIEFDFIRDIFFRIPIIHMDGYIVFYISIFVLFALVLVSLLSYGFFTSKKSIQVQKKIDIFYWLMLFCLISFLVFKTNDSQHLASLAFPVSIFIGILISDSKHKIFYELIHIMLIALIFITHFELI
ncbi:MAG: hypothetical protein IPO92_21000 [Saprospiraceae bacterium]|nr:hypothetical protein [Saprospiraceae bacterium]